jgi:uncharacterized protein HemX
MPFMIGGILIALVLGAGVWGWSTIADLRRDKVETALKTENEDLQETVAEHNAMIARMSAAQADFENRVGLIANEMEGLNRQLSRNVVRRQQTYDSLTAPTVPGQPVNTADLESRANTGMSSLFGELETHSQEVANAPR